MASTNYYTVNGSIVAEEAVGSTGLRTYGCDALGSVVATYDDTGSTQNTYRYKPYGTQLAKTGTAADPSFTSVGSLGYRFTDRAYVEQYVRVRHYDAFLGGQWTTTDPLWPEGAGLSVRGGQAPVCRVDFNGLAMGPRMYIEASRCLRS